MSYLQYTANLFAMQTENEKILPNCQNIYKNGHYMAKNAVEEKINIKFSMRQTTQIQSIRTYRV
jgi:hypothetical protein